MAISNYTELQASVASWLYRDDQVANIPDFIALAESSINADLRLREMLTVTTFATDGATVLPAYWLSFAYVKHEDNQLAYMTPEQFRATQEPSGVLSSYSIEGNQILVQSGAVTLDIAYYARIPALSATPTNFLLTKFPQVYLSKALSWGFQYVLDDQKSAYWESVYQKSISEAKSDNGMALISGAQLRVRTR